MSACTGCPYVDECAERRACQRRVEDIKPVWPLYPKGMGPRDANEAAQSINEHNARVSKAIDSLLIRVARGALAIIGGSILGLYLIGAAWGGS